jgi:hypothetical protein
MINIKRLLNLLATCIDGHAANIQMHPMSYEDDIIETMGFWRKFIKRYRLKNMNVKDSND